MLSDHGKGSPRRNCLKWAGIERGQIHIAVVPEGRISRGYRSPNASCSGADRVHVPDPHVKRGVVVGEVPTGILGGNSRDRFTALYILSRMGEAREEQRIRILGIGQEDDIELLA
jgi:hypothetical protein